MKDQKAQIYLNSLRMWKGKGKLSLSAITRVLKHFDNPQDKIPCIHVAGTNGKGSVSAMLAGIVGGEGYKTGLSTSPHLHSVRERIILDGIPIALEPFNEYLLDIKKASERAIETLTFHEVIQALAFIIFNELKVDFSIHEVGLGGRLDASNVIKRPNCSVITTIGLDHSEILGDTLSEIAKEKAGIIKESGSLITGSIEKEPLSVITKQALLKKNRHFKFDKDYKSILNTITEDITNQQSAIFKSNHESYEYSISLQGEHQILNSTIALKTAEISGFDIKKGCKSLENIFWPARLEYVVYTDKDILLDGAHNPDGAIVLTKYLKQINKENITGIFGALKTKHWRNILNPMLPMVSNWKIVSNFNELAEDPAIILEYIKQQGGCGQIVDNLKIVDTINEISSKNIVVFGSLYLVGKVRAVLEIPEKKIWTRKLAT